MIDLGTCLLSLALANLLRFNFDLDQIEYRFLYAGVPVLMGLRLLSFLAYKTYSGIIFQTSIEDAQRLLLAISTSSALLGLLNFVSFYFTTDYVLPFSILLIDFFVSVFLLTSYRAMVKILYLELRNHNKDKRRVAIYGADSAGVVTKQTLDRDRGTNYQVIAFFDNGATLRKKRLLGVPIYPARQLGRF